MKAHVVIWHYQDSKPRILGVYSSRERAWEDWGSAITQFDSHKDSWSSFDVIECEMNQRHQAFSEELIGKKS